MTRRLVIAAALALSMGALPLLAQGPGGQRLGGPGHGGPGGPGAPGGRPGILGMLHQLDLTDAQREQLHALLEDSRPAAAPGATIRDAEQKLHAAVLADTPDLRAIESLKAALNTAYAAELEHRIEMMQKIAQILTPAQKQQLLQLQPQGPPHGRGPR
jgi:Spy/CpxP family protein refolding chaperone